MKKLDFKKELKDLYTAKSGSFSEVIVPKLNYLMVDGVGDPNTSVAYANAIRALYSLSYTLKFMSKEELAKDYVVPALEGLWWADDMADMSDSKKDNWKWTAMIMLPDWVTNEMFRRAVVKAGSSKPEIDFSAVYKDQLREGKCIQTMHVGPYSDEAQTISKLHEEYFPQHHLVPVGKHHEIYLSDPRRVASEKLRTIIRQPVGAKGKEGR